MLLSLLMLAGWLTATHISPWVSWHAELPFFVAMYGAAAVALWRNRRGDTVTLAAEQAVPAGLLLVLGVQWMGGLVHWHGQALVVALYLGLVGISMVWGRREATRTVVDGRQIPGEWLAWALVVVGLLSLFVALAQVLEIWEGQPAILRAQVPRRPGANLGQPNHLATLFVMGMAAAVYLQMLGRIGRPVLLMLILVLCVGAAVTESRTGVVSVVALAVWWAWRRPDLAKSIPRGWFLVLPASAGGLFVAWPCLFEWWLMDGAVTASGVERLTSSGTDSRVTLWSQAWEASRLRPWVGWGMRDTAEAHNAVAHAGNYSLPFTYSHNLLLDMAIWIGWPLTLLLLLAVLIWVATKCARAQSPLSWFGMALLVPFGIHSLLEFPYAYAYLLVPAMIGVGYAGADSKRPRLMAIPWHAACTGLALFVFAGLWSVVDYLRVEEDYRDARFEMLRIGPPRTTPPPRILVLDQMGDMLSSTRVEIRPGMKPHDLALLQRAAIHNPWSGTQYRYAHALALNGQYAEAVRQLRVLKAQHGQKVHDVLRSQIEESLIKHQMPALPPTMGASRATD